MPRTAATTATSTRSCGRRPNYGEGVSGTVDGLDGLVARFDVDDPSFIADPYPVFRELREATPIFWNERTNQWVLTRFAEISETLRDRRLGRDYAHLYSHAEFGRPDPDPRWAAFHQHERWSLLALEPPDHTRLRRLVSKVFTPRAVSAMRPTLEQLSGELLDECAERGRFELLGDYAQPFSVAVICSLLGVPARGHRAPARLVARHRQDVRAVDHRRRPRRRQPGRRGVHRLHPRPDRGQASSP